MSAPPSQQKHSRSRRADQARRREGRDPNSSQDASEEGASSLEHIPEATIH